MNNLGNILVIGNELAFSRNRNRKGRKTFFLFEKPLSLHGSAAVDKENVWL